MRIAIESFDGADKRQRRDIVADEEPLEIRLRTGGATRTIAVTMRTPGNDFELAAGFLFSERVITGRDDLDRIEYCVDEDPQNYNIVTAVLREGVASPPPALDRHVFTSSACGVCGKASLESLELRGVRKAPDGPVVAAATLTALPDTMRAAQATFAATGGLHAAGLFTVDGELVALREDVGRHNALDKLIGWAMLEGLLQLDDRIVLVSGRSSFEIVQKSLQAGVRIVCAISAPSSLAVTVAEAFDMTLVGFLRDRRFNVYAGASRIG